MTEYVNVRASETLGQQELVAFLKARFPKSTHSVGRKIIAGTECVETRVRTDSQEFDAISDFIEGQRAQGVAGYADFSIGWYLRKYTKVELRNAELLLVKIPSYFEPTGEECGTIYETLCEFCNWGKQLSSLSLDLRRVPQHKDIAQTVAWVEWVVSDKFVKLFQANQLTGAEFPPVFDSRKPTNSSVNWFQLKVTGSAGPIAESTVLGRDAFTPGNVSWKCPLGHSVVATFISEINVRRDSWDGSDICVTNSLFGQGRNLLRPAPLILISQKMYRVIEEASLQGFAFEVVRLV